MAISGDMPTAGWWQGTDGLWYPPSDGKTYGINPEYESRDVVGFRGRSTTR